MPTLSRRPSVDELISAARTQNLGKQRAVSMGMTPAQYDTYLAKVCAQQAAVPGSCLAQTALRQIDAATASLFPYALVR